MVDLGTRQLYAQALPELDDALAKALAAANDKSLPAPPPRLFRRGRGSPLRPLRPAALRLVPLSGARGHHRERRPSADQAPRLGAGHQAHPARAALLPRGAPHPHPPRMALEEGPRRAALFLRRPLRSERGDAAVRPADAQALVADRREAGRRGRADHRSATSRGSPSSMRCSSARRRRSTTTPTASPAARCRKACRSSTTRSR